MNTDHLTIENLCGEIPKSELVAFERKYNLTLPDDYRGILLKYNCAFIEPSSIVLKHSSDIKDTDIPEAEFGMFFGITDDLPKSLENNYQEYILDGRISPLYLPFARGGGDIFLMSLKGDSKEHIYYWCHEFEDEQPNLLHLADNLNDFLANFR